MLAVLMVVVGIALMIALIYGGSTVLQNNSPVRAQVKESAITAFYGLASAYQAYVNANGSVPATNVACSAMEMVPTYLNEVKYPGGMASCSFNTNATYGYYFCYYGSIAQVTYNGFSDAAASFPTGSYILGTTSCGEHTADTAPTTWPTTVYVTYWLLGQ